MPSASASLEDGWKALFDNRFDEARQIFQAALSSEDDEPLRGLTLCAWAQGDSPAVARCLSDLIASHPENSYLPCYLAMAGSPDLHGWPASERMKVFEAALSKTAVTLYRQRLAYELAEVRMMLLDARSGEAAREAGIVIDHWNVVGPFGLTGAGDFLRPFGPETGIRLQYSGWRKEVDLHPVTPVHPTGLLNWAGLIHPSYGVVAYALNAIESQDEGEIELIVHSPSDFRVWWNGKPVLEKSGLNLDTSQTVSTRVTVQKGKNLLAVKTKKRGAWWLRVMLQAVNESSPVLQSVPLAVEDFSDTFLQPFEIHRSVPGVSCGISSSYPFALPAPSSPGQNAVNDLLLTIWHIERAEYDAAKSRLNKCIERFPRAAFFYAMYGDVSLRHATARGGSKARFQQEAESAFTKALELDPYCRNALIGLQTYYMDRDQVDRALDVMDEQIRQYPDLLSSGYAGLLNYSYGLLYSRKGFEAEAASKFELVAKGFVPSYENYRRLFDYYDKNNNLRQAAKIISRALDVFPGYLPFLNRAMRIPSVIPDAPDTIGLLKRAVELNPFVLYYPLALGRALEQKGRYSEALALYEKLRRRYPSHPQPAENYAELAFLVSKPDKAVESYRHVFELEPQRMNPFHVLRDLADEVEFPYLQYDVRLEDVDVAKAEKWKSSRASSIYLLDIMVLELHENGTYDQYIHQAIKILNQEGMRKWAEIVIPTGRNVELIGARTLTPDGTEWAVSNVQELNNQKSLSMYGIEEGAIVEYAYLQRGGTDVPGSNVYSGGYFFGADEDHMLLSKLTLIKPKDLPFNMDANPEDFPVRITREGDREIYEWATWMSEGRKSESFAPPLAERVPSLQVTTARDWLPFVDRVKTTLQGYEERSLQVERLAKQLQEGIDSNRTYVQKVYDWIRETVEDTSGGETSADTVVLQAGGRYQKIRLARHLLQLGGVKARLAIALENDEHDGFRPLPFPNFPGTMVLLVPRQEDIPERIVMDFESRFAALENLNPRLKKMVALVFDDPASYFEPLFPHLWEHALLMREVKLVLRDDHSASLQGTYLYDNMNDRLLREALTNPEVKRRLADMQIAKDLRGIRIDDFSLEDIDDLSKTPRLVFSGALPDVAKPAGPRSLKIAPVLARSLASTLVSEPTRETPIVFNSSPMQNPLLLRFDLTAYLDKGASIVLPDDTFLLTEFGYYSLFYSWDGMEVVLRRSFLMPEQRIEPNEYEGFVEFCRSIDQAEEREIHITFPRTVN